MTVQQILRDKGTGVATIPADMLVGAAIQRLDEEDVGSLVVVASNEELEGIVSERDIVRGLALHGRDVLDEPVAILMTRAVVTCTRDDLVAGIMALMTEQRIRHVPVLSEGRLCGIVSIGDLVKKRLDEVQAESEAMRSYIQQT